MRFWIALGVPGLVTACSSVQPVDPPQMGANEMQQRPGLFSGPDGDFVLVGPPVWPQSQEAEAEVGAGL
jgi:hypothetical protein